MALLKKNHNTVHVNRGGLTTQGAPGNRGSWGPCVLAQTQKSL
ncbi:unnamed protein product [Staurois parvus]|uniref:Uncharacterized protein n=1 Tax=Staurois parvus TaxID=386267 RepID=A0ABN9BTD9_9NEOB|nr:unnamed protein product [Staurois parvus]